MAATSRAPEIHKKSVAAVRIVSVDFQNELDAGELLTGTPTVVETGTSDLTLSSKAVNTSTLTINDRSAVAGQAVQFLVEAGGTAGTTYLITITCGTDSTPAETVDAEVRLEVV